MQILFITGEYPPIVGGVGDYTRHLGRALIAREHAMTVLTGGPVEQPPPDDPPVRSFGAAWNWRSWRQVMHTIRELRPDVVHIQYQTGAYNMHPAINLLPARLHWLRPRPRIVVTAHDLRLPYLFPKADLLRTWVTTRLFNAADALIVTNADDQRRVAGRADRDRELYSPRHAVRAPVYVIPIGSNIEPQPPATYTRAAWRRQLGAQPDDVVIAYFGLLNRTKGAREVLEAFAGLPLRFRLVIIGGAAPLPDDQRYAAEIEAFIAAHDLQQQVRITGSVAPPDVSAYLLAADLAVLPFLDGASYRRGSLLAALVHGLPTITTAPTTSLTPPLIDGVHALIVPQPAPIALRTAIQHLAADAALRDTLSLGARALAAFFAWPAIAAEHETVYHTVLGDRQQATGDSESVA